MWAILLEQCLYLQHFSRYWPVTEFQSPEIFEIIDTKRIGVTTLTIQGHVTSSSLGNNGAPIGNRYLGIIWSRGPEKSRSWPQYTKRPISRKVLEIEALSSSLYLQPFPRYLTLTILGSRPWPFRVTWHHRSRDHMIPMYPFPKGAPLSPSRCLQPFSRYLPLSVLGSRPYISGSRDVIGHVTIGLAMVHFLLVVLCTQVSISNGFRDIPPQTSCAHWHNPKSLLRMRDITWCVPPM